MIAMRASDTGIGKSILSVLQRIFGRTPEKAGYNDTDLMEVLFQKNAALTDAQMRAFPYATELDVTTLAVTYAASLLPSRPLRVLDFGGSFAFHYRIARLASPHIPLRWAIVETKQLVERAVPLATDELRFFPDIKSATSWLGATDLVFSSGVVQYLPDTEDAITRLVEIGAPVMVWNRMAFCEAERHTEDQKSLLSENGPGPLPPGFVDREVFFSVTRIPKSEFMKRHTTHDLIWHFNSDYPGFIFVKR
jgi:putative methyltransferase (TIGR04325 family)